MPLKPENCREIPDIDPRIAERRNNVQRDLQRRLIDKLRFIELNAPILDRIVAPSDISLSYAAVCRNVCLILQAKLLEPDDLNRVIAPLMRASALIEAELTAINVSASSETTNLSSK